MSDKPTTPDARIAALTPEQRELLFRKMAEVAKTNQAVRIARRADRNTAPLSFVQQQLWVLDQLQPGLSVYNVPALLRVDGPLDVKALETSLLQLVERHESLRTVFAASQGEARQVIRPAERQSIPVTDLSGLPEAERERAARTQAAEEVARPFSLDAGPLLRARLLKLSAQSHLLVLTVHHIVVDEQAIKLLVSELAALYGATVAGKPSPLPALELQYGDFAAWQREWLKGDTLEKQLGFWRKQLANLTPLQLPLDHARPRMQSFKGARFNFALSAETSDALKALCRQANVTPFMALLAGFKVLLHRYTGQTDLTVGTPVSGRSRAELEGMLGFFVNTVVLRTEASGAPTFRQLLGRVRETALSAFSNQDVAFEKLVEVLAPERSLDRNPLFQVMFVYEDRDSRPIDAPPLKLSTVRPEVSTEKFDLTLTVGEEQGRFTGTFSFATDLFDAASIERMSGHLVRILDHAAREPDRAIGELDLLTAEERRRIVEEWNATKADFPSDATLHGMVEAQVQKTPSAVAVEFEGQSIDYAELNRRANGLAHKLSSLGIGPETRVAISVERSVEMVVGLLGILKSGAAYVPVDPELPKDRIAFMLEDCGAKVLLTQKHLREKLPPFAGEVITLSADATERADKAPVTNVGPRHLAYGIYTSGSTGRPKLALNAHRGIVNRLWWMQNAYKLDGSDAVLQKTPFSFDVSVWEFFWPLMFGARLVVAKPGGHKEPQYLRAVIAERGITTLHFVPSMLQAFLEDGGAVSAKVRRVICSGEALPYELQQRFFESSKAELHNLYGPTEAAVDVTYWACRPNNALRIVPIGKPISNLRMYVLDPSLNPVPVGVSGELYIGGVGVGRGYAGRPELTAEKFVPDPFSPEKGARLYRTGDLGRHLLDGNIEYQGRVDFQVKIRGFRIELGEIEAAMLAVPKVREAVVIAREDKPGEKRLVAYYSPKDGATDADFRAALARSLPEYMVPSAFIPLDALPLSPNGKVERKALPAPDWNSFRKEYVAPRNELETKLAGVWAKVLGLDRVGIHDGFFQIGGDSLKVIRVAALAREAGITMPPPLLFANPTVAELARALEAAKTSTGGDEWRTEPQLVKGGVAPLVGPVPVAFQEERFLRIQAGTRKAGGLGKPAGPHGYVFRGPMDLAIVEKAVNAFLQRHRVLWSHYQPSNDGFTKELLEPKHIPLHVVDLSHLSEIDALDEAMRDIARNQRSCDDFKRPAPYFKATVHKIAADVHMLTAVSSLGVFDAGSFHIFWRELSANYQKAAKGEPITFEPAPVQYADYAAWQRQWHSGKWVEQAAAYWKKRLAGARPITRFIQSDHPREPIDRIRAENFWAPFVHSTVSENVSPEVMKKLKAQIAADQSSVAVVAFAAFAATLGLRGGVSDVTMRTTNDARRRVAGLDGGVVGFLQNFAYFRLDLSGSPSFRQLCGRAREEVFGHMSLPEFQLIPYVYPQFDELARVLFNYRGAQLHQPPQLPNLELEQLPWDRHGELFIERAHWDDWSGNIEDAPDGGLVIFLDVNTALWTEQTATSIARDFVGILERGAADPDGAVRLGPPERAG